MEDQLTVFIDLLGFSEASGQADLALQTRVLALLVAIAGMRAEFSDQSDPITEATRAIRLRPTITTFSDHIVASYPTARLIAKDENEALTLAFLDVTHFVAKVAAAALLHGFLIRGGLAYGPLFHTSGVVFGPAMIEAYQLESRTAVYPRVVISPTLLERAKHAPILVHSPHFDHDGLGCVDFVRFMLGALSPHGAEYHQKTREWFDTVAPTIRTTTEALRNANKIQAASKWLWFARKFSNSLRTTNPVILQHSGIDPNSFGWADQMSLFS